MWDVRQTFNVTKQCNEVAYELKVFLWILGIIVSHLKKDRSASICKLWGYLSIIAKLWPQWSVKKKKIYLIPQRTDNDKFLPLSGEIHGVQHLKDCKIGGENNPDGH